MISISAVVAFCCVAIGLNPSIVSAKKPNFVFILSDDHGAGAVGWRNPQIKSPNLDNLANTGVKLEEFYTYQFCSPTRYVKLNMQILIDVIRAAFLTGRYPWKANGIRGNLEPLATTIEGTDLGFTFLPERLKTEGYATHHVGKWHQGFADYRYTPTARGFDSTLGFFGGQEGPLDQKQIAANVGACGNGPDNQPIPIYDIWEDGKAARQKAGQSADVLWSTRAIEKITDHAKANAINPGSDNPLFLYVAFNTPRKFKFNIIY